MMRALLVLLFLLSASIPAGAAELHTVQVFDTGPFACAAGWKDLWWENRGPTIQIKQTTIWMGMDYGGRADYTATLYRYDRRANALDLIQFVGWDHYTDPTAPGSFTESFGGDWITVPSGGYLRLTALCQELTPSNHGHVGVFVRYTTVDPIVSVIQIPSPPVPPTGLRQPAQ
jgi:hypothetical protein